VTGAPIYLVSACTSGEEFVAAFRRYADKNGLFVPIREPLPVGRRSRFAVTLKDGGVMIEGEAEIVSSARTASVLHGRVGMTLRFLEPDDASKTILRDLEKARLAMRPPPPSVSPRPAEIPAVPRPVPPPVQGRIDAVNALAECVAIGDPEAPAATTAPAAPAALPPKAGPRFVAPAIAKTDERDGSMPPSITPRATPQPEQPGNGPEPHAERAERADMAPAAPSISGFSKTMIAVAPLLDPGPTSDTFVAVLPPEPPVAPPPVAPPLVAPPIAATPPAAPPIAASVPTTPPPVATPPVATPPVATPPVATPTVATSPVATSPVAKPIVATPPVATSPVAPPPVASPPAATPIIASPPVASPPAATPIVAPPTAAPPTTAKPTAAKPTASTPAVPRRAVEMAAIPRPITKPQPAETPRDRNTSDTMIAVPMPGTTAPSAPTDIGGVLVDLRPPTDSVVSAVLQDDPSARTQIHAGVPPRDPPAVAPHDGLPAPNDALAGRPPARAEGITTQRGPAVERAKPTEPQPSRPEVPEPKRKPALEPELDPELELDDVASADPEAAPTRGGATHIGMPPIPRSAAPVSSLPAAPRPAPPIVAPERPTILEVEIAEPTDLSLGPPEPPTPLVEPPSREELALAPPEAPGPRQQRKTVIGVVIPPSGLSVLPANVSAAASDAEDASLQAADEVTSTARVVVGDPTADATAPVAPPEPRFPPRIEEPTPSGDWIIPPSSATPLRVPDEATAAPATPASLPSGDWAIALDPKAPDGWSEPFEMISPEHLTEDPASGPAPAAVAPPPPRDAPPKRPTPRPNVLPALEPKVQIDPTLIQPLQPVASDPPLRPMPPDAPLGAMPLDNPFRHAPSSSVDMPSYGPPPVAVAPAPPLMNMMAPQPQPGPFVMRRGQPAAHTGEAPAYPMDPSYQMVPVPGLPAPEPLTAADSGLGDPRYSSETALPVRPGRRRAIIVIVSALVAVVIGIVLLLLFGGKHDAGTAPGTTPGTAINKAPAMPVEPNPTDPTASAPAPDPATATTRPTPDTPNRAPERAANAPASASDPVPAAPKPSTASPAPAPGTAATAAGSGAVAGAALPGESTCFADVSSVPAGAEIVIDQTNVIGTTPQKVTLPCGNPVELTIRKGHFVAAVHTVTPTADGTKLKVALAKPTFQVKVSSTPAGATITLNGKSLGVTPTMIKIPAFEASALTITKDGYATETENVTPKSNGVAVHTALKKLDHKKPR